MIKCKGVLKICLFLFLCSMGAGMYVVVIGCDAMEFLLSIWYSFDLVTNIKVNQKPADFVRKDARR